MGWDAFGLPAEQYAIKSGRHPREFTEENVAKFKAQLTRLGFNYDWEPRGQHDRPRLFQMDAMDFPAAVRVVVQSGDEQGGTDFDLHRQRSRQRAAGVRVGSPRELVPRAGHGAGERGSRRWQERGGRLPGRTPAHAPVDAADHGLRGTAHQGTGRAGLAGVDQTAATQLDRTQRGGARHVHPGKFREPPDEPRRAGAGHGQGRPSRRGRRAGGTSRPPDGGVDRVHHAARHALRRDVHGARARASAGGRVRGG